MFSQATVTPTIALSRLGLIDYQEAWNAQKKIQEEVITGDCPNTLLLLEHPSVYTAGRRTEAHERPLDETPVIDVDRGGKITWHGEGQLVGYPIVKLKNSNDVVGFVREVETALIEVCRELGIDAVRYCERSVVWLRDEKGDRKIAAIGIRVAKGVTMHGFAINANPELAAISRIVPCGLPDADVTSLSAELGREVTVTEILPIVEKYLTEALTRVAI
jgi:lipoyl(octanoyl) transferase